MKYRICLLLVVCLALSDQTIHAQPSVTTPAAESADISGKVVETMNTAGYTYVQVDSGGKKVWAAAVQFAVKVGDTVSFVPSQPMPNYHSKSLNRDFDLVYFASGITVKNNASGKTTGIQALPPGHPALNGSAAPVLPPGHPSLTSETASKRSTVSGIKRADGGKTIEEIFATQSKLAAKQVIVRGKIVKYNSAIMGKNWLHIQDGSGTAAKANNDLTVTTATDAKLGDTVLVTGTIALKKDFGGGYKYDVIIQDAKVVVE